MIKLLINFTLLIFVLTSCQLDSTNNIKKNFVKKKNLIKKKIESTNDNNVFVIKYIVEEPYFIEGVRYIPKENYSYEEIGLATFYGKEMHNTRTLNNDFNKVTELLGRHKTLPLPSIIKITNIENGLSLVIKINDRHKDNSSIIQVSRKVAQLLRFYKDKIARVKVEIISDPSKQMKVVTKSMSDPNFTSTIDKAPTEEVSISNLDEILIDDKDNNQIIQPIEIGFEEVSNKKLYLKIYNFSSYEEINKIINELNINYKSTTQKESEYYSIILGPLENIEANNLVLSFISKGYKKTEILLQ